jgi:nitrate/nitrite transporter NarK
LPFGWQWPYLVPGLLCLPLLVIWFGLELRQPASGQTAPLPLARILRIRAGWVLGMYHALSWGSVLTLGSWVPSLLAEVFAGTTAVKFAWGGALVMMISGIGRLSGGFILYRFSPLLIANGSILVLCVVYLGLFTVSAPVPIVILAVLAAWFASINFGAFFHLASRATATGSMATLLGFVNLLANLGAVLFTFMFGWFKDHLGSFTMSFLVLASICCAAFFLGRPVLRRQWTQPESEASRT